MKETLIEKNRRLRSERLQRGKLKGDHTKEEWEEMKEFFNYTCVRCLKYDNTEILLQRDHIVPLYQGGSNGLDNIQPLCAKCNQSKGPENYDWRPRYARILKVRLPKKYRIKDEQTTK